MHSERFWEETGAAVVIVFFEAQFYTYTISAFY